MPAIKMVDKMTSDERRLAFRDLLSNVVMPQREALLRARALTWQSAYVDDDGYLAEMIAALVLGTPGRNRRGKSKSSGDLSDETEVKKAYRLDPNIDFVLSGQASADGRTITLLAYPDELASPHIVRQFNSNASSVQVLDADDLRPLQVPLARTETSGSWTTSGSTASIQLSRKSPLAPTTRNAPITVCVRMERGHLNFGSKDRPAFAHMLEHNITFVFYQHDRAGRPQIIVVQSQLGRNEQQALLDLFFRGRQALKAQWQPYLFLDNERELLYAGGATSVGKAFGGRLLAAAVSSGGDVEVTHWDPDGETPVIDALPLLTGWPGPGSLPSFASSGADGHLSDPSDRRRLSDEFFQACMVRYYNALEPYCEMTATPRNIGFGNLSQHLVSLTTGIRGTRSGARGADLVDSDGNIGEIKLATGQPGDAMGTEDLPRLNLQAAKPKMHSWAQLFPVRLVHTDNGLEALVHSPNTDTMELFRRQVDEYFTDSTSTNLQYHAKSFPHDAYGTRGRELTFERTAHFQEGAPARFH